VSPFASTQSAASRPTSRRNSTTRTSVNRSIPGGQGLGDAAGEAGAAIGRLGDDVHAGRRGWPSGRCGRRLPQAFQYVPRSGRKGTPATGRRLGVPPAEHLTGDRSRSRAVGD
jgi:hypothetical protein